MEEEKEELEEKVVKEGEGEQLPPGCAPVSWIKIPKTGGCHPGMM